MGDVGEKERGVKILEQRGGRIGWCEAKNSSVFLLLALKLEKGSKPKTFDL